MNFGIEGKLCSSRYLQNDLKWHDLRSLDIWPQSKSHNRTNIFASYFPLAAHCVPGIKLISSFLLVLSVSWTMLFIDCLFVKKAWRCYISTFSKTSNKCSQHNMWHMSYETWRITNLRRYVSVNVFGSERKIIGKCPYASWYRSSTNEPSARRRQG